jgi:hypothetical protein
MITGWLVKLVLIFAVVAVLLFDAGSAVVNFFTLDSRAEEIAITISNDITNRDLEPTDREIVDRASLMATEAGARLVKAELDDEGIVRVRLRRSADTLVFGRIKQLHGLLTPTADGKASSS